MSMTIQDFSDRIKAAKTKDLPMVFKQPGSTETFEVGGVYYGVKQADGSIANPQVGEDPNCVTMILVPATV